MKNQAFTLVELLVVVLIIGILAAIAVQQYKRVVYKAKFTQATLMLNSIYKAQQEYFAVHGVYAINFSSLDIDLPKTNGTPNNYAHWNWGHCFITSTFGGCGFADSEHGSARQFIWWSSGRSTCAASEGSIIAREICQAVTGKTAEQGTLSGGNYHYNFKF